MKNGSSYPDFNMEQDPMNPENYIIINDMDSR